MNPSFQQSQKTQMKSTIKGSYRRVLIRICTWNSKLNGTDTLPEFWGSDESSGGYEYTLGELKCILPPFIFSLSDAFHLLNLASSVILPLCMVIWFVVYTVVMMYEFVFKFWIMITFFRAFAWSSDKVRGFKLWVRKNNLEFCSFFLF